MNLLVDGHNLIGQTPGLSLADPDDEAKLVLMLRLNGYGITCYFARSPQDADEQLIQRIRALPRPREWALVSSDRVVVRAAQERGMRLLESRAFALQLAPVNRKATPSPQSEKPDVRLSEAELREWLRLFGEDEG
jgi:predicted RNA-binding protein with PIN domain